MTRKIRTADVNIAALSKKAPNVGLSSFNILYRKLRKLNHDYKILRRVGTAAASALVLDLFFIAWIKNLYG